MIQFNLLPDVKLEYIKARRTKRAVILIAGGTAALSLTILIILFVVVNIAQKQHLKNLTNDIKKHSEELRDTPDLNKILTIQNQLNSLPQLHNNKPVVSRLFGYITQLTPNQVSIDKFIIDYSANTISITGDADSLSTVNQYADTLKFTTYENADKTKNGKAFSDVVLKSFDRDVSAASYQIDLKFDLAIFDSASKVTLTVPSIISTRSATEKPASLFQGSTPGAN